MNEAETRAEHIDPALKAAGWGVVEGSKILREHRITAGRIEGHGRRGKADIADYVLVYRNTKLAVIEAKAWDEALTEGVGQAKDYAAKLAIRFAYSTNGKGIYAIDLETAKEGEIAAYPTPDELWALTFAEANAWRDRFAAVPFEDKGGSHPGRYYQDIAVERVMQAIAEDRQRILLTLATGTGKTFIAFQIAWKLFHARWNLSREATRRPRILFLADRNILANQAYNAFSAFPEDALVRIEPADIKKKGKVPKNGSLFFTIFQTFMASAGSATGASVPEPAEQVVTEDLKQPVSERDELVELPVPTEKADGCMYILECGDGSFYTGSTTDLRIRLDQHRMGEGAKHTAARLPVKLVYYAPFDRIDKAFDREKQVQGWSRAKKIALIQGNVSKLKQLSSSYSIPAPVRRMVPEPVEGYFGEYPADFFDFIVIDECHRGGANDASTWREILEYFSPAVQLGLTATPKRKDNVDTYAYFGEPVYIYSLKQGINDGFLTPFKVKQIQTTLDYYIYTPDDAVVEGEIEQGKLYEEADFNRRIEIREREKKRVQLFLAQINQNEKTLVFCANQSHALLVRDLVNQLKTSKDPNYCARVTADDGERGEQALRDFQDNEKTIPTILTTSQKLSTGVDARNIRNIVLMRPVNSMIEFKQIIGRGTRLYDGKDYFTIYDFVKAHLNFQDPEWDGEPITPISPISPTAPITPPPGPPTPPEPPIAPPRQKVKVRLADGKERSIQHMMTTTFWHPDGTPMSAQQFMELLFGKLPDFFQSEAELRALWSAPDTRAKLLQGLAEKDFGHDKLVAMQQLIDAEKSDLFDVLAYVAYLLPPVTRAERADHARVYINSHFTAKQQAFLNFVLQHYVTEGVTELDQSKLKPLLRLKYHDSIADAVADLGGKPEEIGQVFAGFQKHLYAKT
ncbi:MAG: DEAD/DEAH box helicase family protein [Verrucomicrobia bacterium]|nr:DEAD/DEAH box helicase family protein [Verrucomicrobiota bacterium]